MEKEKVEVVVGKGPGEEVSSRAIVQWQEDRRQSPREPQHLERDNILKHKISRNKPNKT